MFILLAVIPSGKTLVPRKIELITFGDDKNNNILEEEYFIPKPKAVNTQQKGITAAGLECFCLKNSTSIYLPPVKNEECICKKNCCKARPANHYLPPDDCEICPKCVCDRKTFKLINKESGDCPACR